MYICLYIYTFLSLNRIRDKCPGLVSTYALQHAATHCNTTATHCNTLQWRSSLLCHLLIPHQQNQVHTISNTHTQQTHTHRPWADTQYGGFFNICPRTLCYSRPCPSNSPLVTGGVLLRDDYSFCLQIQIISSADQDESR